MLFKKLKFFLASNFVSSSFALIHAILFILAFPRYEGSFSVFLVFSFLSYILLFSGFYRKVSNGYLFLTVFLWIGFWLKLVLHIIFDENYVEPTGRFFESNQSWDELLGVATIAFFGVIVSHASFQKLFKNTSTFVLSPHFRPPVWYYNYRTFIWSLLIFSILFIAAINAYYGVHQIGLTPRTILMWPLNAMISWLVSIGFALAITCLLYWDWLLKKELKFAFFCVVLEAFVSSGTMLSRSIFVFRIAPQAIVVFANFKEKIKLNLKKIMVVGALALIFIFVSISATSISRSYLYPTNESLAEKNAIIIRLESLDGGIELLKRQIAKGQPKQKDLIELETEHKFLTDKFARFHKLNFTSFIEKFKNNFLNDIMNQFSTTSIVRIYHLIVDRFIGLEGLMAVVGYAEKDLSLLKKGLLESRSLEKVSFFQQIAQSNYQDAEKNIWQFASLPGIVAFLYYSANLLIVFAGMIVITFFILSYESLIFRYTGNSFLCALVGLGLANMVAQFGLAPLTDLPYFTLIFITVVIIAVLSKKISDSAS